ncbi:MAG: flagellar export chaperone FliS [Clostridiales bacterium]|nr:flagellar export chaperone FliS [Clostridiales bacterium]
MYAKTLNPVNIYQENSVNTASPGKLIIMLYDGAIKFCRFAEMAIDEKNIERRHVNIKKAKRIIQELAFTLNRDIEISEQLGSLYAFMERELINANVQNDKNKIITVREMLEELKGAWESIVN